MQIVDVFMKNRKSAWDGIDIEADLIGLKLDADKIGSRSESRSEIRLPYSGKLPKSLGAVTGASVSLNIQLVQGARASLLITTQSGLDIRCILDTADSEILSVMDRFIFQPQSKTDLTPYCHGCCTGHYIEWKRIAECPTRVYEIFSALPSAARHSVFKNMICNLENTPAQQGL